MAGLDDPQMDVVGGETAEADWYALLASCHCMVFPSYGEGFGLPPREAALSGMPVISSSWLGLWDADQWAYPLPVGRMLPAQFDKWEANEEGGEWAEPNTDILEMLMNHVASNYGQALRWARKGRNYLLTNFTWARCAEMILRQVC